MRSPESGVVGVDRGGFHGIAVLVLPPLLLMGLIWFLSSQPDLTTGLGLLDLVGRKIVHAVSFGLLCFLWWRALRDRARVAALPVAFALALGYAAVDEYHQSFVEGRIGSPVDVVIDGLGATTAALLVRRRGSRSPRSCAGMAGG